MRFFTIYTIFTIYFWLTSGILLFLHNFLLSVKLKILCLFVCPVYLVFCVLTTSSVSLPLWTFPFNTFRNIKYFTDFIFLHSSLLEPSQQFQEVLVTLSFVSESPFIYILGCLSSLSLTLYSLYL